jgi:antitoxin ChpS
MTSRLKVQEALHAFTDAVTRREGDRFQSAILFGSHARGDDRPESDVDVAVILTELPASLIDTKLALADIAYDVLLDTGVLIQPLPLSEDEWRHPEHHGNPHLVENIHREGRPL